MKGTRDAESWQPLEAGEVNLNGVCSISLLRLHGVGLFSSFSVWQTYFIFLQDPAMISS